MTQEQCSSKHIKMIATQVGLKYFGHVCESCGRRFYHDPETKEMYNSINNYNDIEFFLKEIVIRKRSQYDKYKNIINAIEYLDYIGIKRATTYNALAEIYGFLYRQKRYKIERKIVLDIAKKVFNNGTLY